MKTAKKTGTFWNMKSSKIKEKFTIKPASPYIATQRSHKHISTKPLFGFNPTKKKDLTWPQAKALYPGLNPRGDADKDGVKNWLDCRPFDPKRQDEPKRKRVPIKERRRAYNNWIQTVGLIEMTQDEGKRVPKKLRLQEEKLKKVYEKAYDTKIPQIKKRPSSTVPASFNPAGDVDNVTWGVYPRKEKKGYIIHRDPINQPYDVIPKKIDQWEKEINATNPNRYDVYSKYPLITGYIASKKGLSGINPKFEDKDFAKNIIAASKTENFRKFREEEIDYDIERDMDAPKGSIKKAKEIQKYAKLGDLYKNRKKRSDRLISELKGQVPTFDETFAYSDSKFGLKDEKIEVTPNKEDENYVTEMKNYRAKEKISRLFPGSGLVSSKEESALAKIRQKLSREKKEEIKQAMMKGGGTWRFIAHEKGVDYGDVMDVYTKYMTPADRKKYHQDGPEPSEVLVNVNKDLEYDDVLPIYSMGGEDELDAFERESAMNDIQEPIQELKDQSPSEDIVEDMIEQPSAQDLIDEVDEEK